MGMALELLVFFGVFLLGLSLVGSFLKESDNERRKLRAEHESERYDRKRSSSWPKTSSPLHNATSGRTRQVRAHGLQPATATPTRKSS